MAGEEGGLASNIAINITSNEFDLQQVQHKIILGVSPLCGGGQYIGNDKIDTGLQRENNLQLNYFQFSTFLHIGWGW